MANVQGKFYTAETQRRGVTPSSPPNAVDDPQDPVSPSSPVSFISLTDTPSSYSGQTLKGVRVNAGETGLEFYTISSGGIPDAPNDGLAYARKSLGWSQLSPYDLDDVGASNGQVLTWSTVNSRYEPTTVSGASNWTVIGSDIYRNSKISVGHTTAPAESIDLGVAGWIKTGWGASDAGGIIFPYSTASANSRSWSIQSDGSSFGDFVINRSATQSSDPKTGTASFIINNTGDVGIGGIPFSFSNYTYLQITGKNTSNGGSVIIRTSDNSFSFQTIVSNTGTVLLSSGAIPLSFNVNGSERFRVSSAGNLIIGTTTDLGFKFHNSGTSLLQGIVTFSTDMAFGTATGTKIGTGTTQKLAFWNKAPIIQPTTGITGATLVGGGGTTITDTDTFGGYTLAKVVAALINTGILA